MRGRGSIRVLLIVLAAAFVAAGCGKTWPSPPPARIPTVAGVAERREETATSEIVYLTNGTAVEIPKDYSIARFGVGYQSGNLVLARLDAEPRFVNPLDPLSGSPGCWDPWDSDVYIAWDLGSAILFPRGLELPKAPDYDNSAPQSKVDGRTVWTFESPYGATFCVNELGQVDWVKPYRPGAD
jgi:hypothetical protein